MSYGPYLISKEIDNYADRCGSAGNTEAAPYDSASLAEIYAPRVRQLFDLQNQGFKYAEWKWDGTENRWHGVEVTHFVTIKANMNGNYFANCECGWHLALGRTTSSIAVDKHLERRK